MTGCNCNVGLSNTGRPNCIPIQKVASRLFLMPIFANDGTKNGIDMADLPNFELLVNEADASKRLFPLPAFENIEMAKADSQFEESASGRKAFLRSGVRSFSGELWAEDSSPVFLGKLVAGRCVDFGFYILDVEGNLIGAKDGDILYPIPVDVASWDPRWMPATDSSVQKIMVAFDWARNFDESTLWMVTSAEAGDLSQLDGLVDVDLIPAVPGNALNSFNARLQYGTSVNLIKFSGAVLADFQLVDNSTTATVSLSTLTEGPEGTYSIAPTAALTDGVSYTLKVVKTGFSGEMTFTYID